MYAVIRTGGKQHRVEPGQSIRVEKLPGEVGDSVELPGGAAGRRRGRHPGGSDPSWTAPSAVGTITAQGRGSKLTIFKMKRRKGYRRKQGHRQAFTEIRVDKIEG